MSSRICLGLWVALIGWGLWCLGRNTNDPVPVNEVHANPAPVPLLDPDAGKTDHPMWGGDLGRNLVNLTDKEIPGNFKIEEVTLWKAQIGSRGYGNTVVALGKVFCGTNNEHPRNNRDRGKPTEDDPDGPPLDKSILMCFAEKSGKFLWQGVHDKNPLGQAADWPREGICSTPCVDGRRIYYVSSAGAVVCAGLSGLDVHANEGFKDEKYRDETDADIIWSYDMVNELKVFPHNMASCSPLVVADLVFVSTSNGVDESHVKVPSPDAPDLIALNKKTGALVWTSNPRMGAIMHGQWSSPAYGVIAGVPQLIFGAGDGWIFGLKPETGEPLWEFDANPKGATYELGGKSTRSDFIGTPVVYREKIFIGTGQDPEHFEGVGHFWCIDPAGKKGDISPDLVVDDSVDPPKTKPNPNSGAVWHYGGMETRKHAKRDFVFGRTMSTACIVDDIIYIPELAGYFHCIDARTGKFYWQADLKSALWGSAFYADGKVYVGNEDGDLFVFRHEKNPTVLDEVEEAAKAADEKSAKKRLKEVRDVIAKRYRIAKIEFEEPIRRTPIVANGVLYVMTEQSLFAIRKK